MARLPTPKKTLCVECLYWHVDDVHPEHEPGICEKYAPRPDPDGRLARLAATHADYGCFEGYPREEEKPEAEAEVDPPKHACPTCERLVRTVVPESFVCWQCPDCGSHIPLETLYLTKDMLRTVLMTAGTV